MDLYVFSKPGFKKRQSAKLKPVHQRGSILISASINHDPKILALHAQKDYVLLPVLLEIWAHLDLESETWEVRVDHFDRWARHALASGAPGFNIKKRLEWLKDNGLIDYLTVKTPSEIDPKHGLNDFQTTCKQGVKGGVNDMQTGGKGGGKQDLSTPFVMPQTQSPTGPITNKQTNKQTDPFGIMQANGSLDVADQNFGQGFENFITEATSYISKTRSPNLQNLAWVDGFLERILGEIRRQRPDLDAPSLLACWHETCDKASAKNAIAPKWYETTFLGIARDFIPTNQADRDSSKPKNGIHNRLHGRDIVPNDERKGGRWV